MRESTFRKPGAAWVASIILAACAALAVVLVGCGSGANGSSFHGSQDGGSDGGLSGDGFGCLTCDDGASVGDGGAGDGNGQIVLPPNFVSTVLGGYALGPSLLDGGADAGLPANPGTGCALVVGVVRDFKYAGDPGPGQDDPDFGNFCCGVTPGLVQATLDANGKPQFAGICDQGNADVSDTAVCPGGQMLTTQANFTEWFHDTPDVNLPYLVYLEFVKNGSVSTFEADGNSEYFPLDGAGWGNNATVGGVAHNFGFTTELHLLFTYNGGETFSFTGDDDVWVFIDGKLAVDIGGVHPSATSSVQLDGLGLTKGSQYPLDIFNAERHLTNSDFRVDTNLSFANCGTIPTGTAQ
ncbi:MAG: fibro-slime domain-containing protein [Polyangiaceae bacterium]